MRMVEADRIRAEKTVEIDQPLIVGRVVKIRAVAFLEVDDDLKPSSKTCSAICSRTR